MLPKRVLIYSIGLCILTGCFSACNRSQPFKNVPTIQQSPAVAEKTPQPNNTPNPQEADKNTFYRIDIETIENVESTLPIKIKLRAVDQNGKTIPSFSDKVVVTIAKWPKDGSQHFASGPNIGKFENGEAIFNNLTIDKPGEEYMLKVSTTNVATYSNTFNVIPQQKKEVIVWLNGKKKIMKLEPPNVLIDTDGDRYPVYSKDIKQFSLFGKYYKVKYISPTEVVVDEIPTPMGAPPSTR